MKKPFLVSIMLLLTSPVMVSMVGSKQTATVAYAGRTLAGAPCNYCAGTPGCFQEPGETCQSDGLVRRDDSSSPAGPVALVLLVAVFAVLRLRRAA